MKTVEFYETRDGQQSCILLFFAKITHLYYSTSSVKNHKKHRNAKSKKQKENESITLAERRMTNHENME